MFERWGQIKDQCTSSKKGENKWEAWLDEIDCKP